MPGFIDEVMQYTLDTAPYPEPVLAFAGALSLQALLAGRKVCDAMDMPREGGQGTHGHRPAVSVPVRDRRAEALL